MFHSLICTVKKGPSHELNKYNKYKYKTSFSFINVYIRVCGKSLVYD